MLLARIGAAPKIKVLVVDDSALIRNLLSEIINRQPDMTVVGAAPDPYAAREMMRERNPDVLTWTSRCRAWTSSSWRS